MPDDFDVENLMDDWQRDKNPASTPKKATKKPPSDPPGDIQQEWEREAKSRPNPGIAAKIGDAAHQAWRGVIVVVIAFALALVGTGILAVIVALKSGGRSDNRVPMVLNSPPAIAETEPQPRDSSSQPKASSESTSSEKTIYTGPRGGKYHLSPNGKKVYERKK